MYVTATESHHDNTRQTTTASTAPTENKTIDLASDPKRGSFNDILNKRSPDDRYRRRRARSTRPSNNTCHRQPSGASCAWWISVRRVLRRISGCATRLQAPLFINLSAAMVNYDRTIVSALLCELRSRKLSSTGIYAAQSICGSY